jgi:DNA ligase-1
MNFKPMLAASCELDKLRFPLYASAKLDGVRAVIRDGVVLSRSLKPIPNTHVQGLFGALEGLDGELVVGLPTSPTCYRDTVSGVMSKDGEPSVMLFVFDTCIYMDEPYNTRFERVHNYPQRRGVVKLSQALVTTLDELLLLESQMLALGYEGLILRDPVGLYKFGRSTAKEGGLLKLKRMNTDEGIVIGFVEQMHNANEATTNELGRTQRSSHKENKHGKSTLGALQVRWGEVEFEVGTGFTDYERQLIWDAQDAYIGSVISFNHFPIGVKDKPRHPSFKGFRDRIDL